MVGNLLPTNLDLIELAQTESNKIFVIVESTDIQPTGPPGGLATTRRPSRPGMGSVTFTSARSYLRLPQWSPGRQGRVEFNFKTIQRHGVLMVSSPSRGRSDFFAVELIDGDLYAVFNLGGQTQRFLVGSGLNDAQPHHVIIQHTGRQLRFTVDGQQHSGRLSPGDDASLDLGSTFFVGGTSNPEQLPWLLYSRMEGFYRGCIWDLRFDGGDIVELGQLRLDQGMHLMSPGCASMPIHCTATSCQHGGICRERWGGRRCYCLLTAYTGRQCQRGQLLLHASLFRQKQAVKNKQTRKKLEKNKYIVNQSIRTI